LTIREQVAGYIAPLYAADLTSGSLLRAGADELEELEQRIEEVMKQHFVDTATWGLQEWEKLLGLPTDLSKSLPERRSVVRSHIRGSGTVTVSLLKNVAESYDNGHIEVTEDPELYRFTVRFADTLGLPPNLDDLKAAIEAVKPAHLFVEYEFKYLLLNQVHGVMTIDQLQNRRLYDFAPFIPA
jgi:uncharacterized protein YmfQ (DUF2313 family)